MTTGNQLFELSADDAERYDKFGDSVAIDGTTAIVGARADTGRLSSTGAAYLFDTTTGRRLFRLTPSDPGSSYFGDAVGISGNTAIIGASWGSGGSAYLFDVTNGTELFQVRASDAERSDYFGWSVGISGNTAIVGAFGDRDEGQNTGSAYLFDVTTGEQLFKLTASDAAEWDAFGWSVGISGNTAIVGAFLNDDAGDNSGSAYLFDVTTGKQLFKLTASDATRWENFGRSVAISGNTAIIGVNGDNGVNEDGYTLVSSGSAYLFDVRTGEQLSKLTTSDAAIFDEFGYTVAMSGNTVIIGATGDDEETGSAYLFTSATPSSDLTGNGFVDFEDLTVLLANWNKPGATLAEGNLVNADTTPVNFEDLTVLLADWTGPGPAASPEAALGAEAVPEPSSLLIAVLAALGLSVRWRRRRRKR